MNQNTVYVIVRHTGNRQVPCYAYKTVEGAQSACDRLNQSNGDSRYTVMPMWVED